MVRTSKISRTIAVVVAVAAVGGVATAPAAHATKNTNRYKNSAEAKRKKQAKLCNDLQISLDNWATAYNADKEAGDDANAQKDFENWDQTLQNAHAAGCSWARRTPPLDRGREGAVTNGATTVSVRPGR